MNVADLEIKPLDRHTMYAMLGLISVMEPETEVAMNLRALNEHIHDEFNSPHSRPWFISFHASEYPGIPANACKRYLTYRMMNFIGKDPVPPWVTTTGTLGKAGELDIASAWFENGRMLAVPEGRPGVHQLGFVDPSRWMTASTDLPILPKGWKRPHIVEVKGKADEVLEEMLKGRAIKRPDGTTQILPRGPDPGHVNQLKATVGLAHEYDWGEVTVCPSCWRIKYADVFANLRPDHMRLNPQISPQQAVETNMRWCTWCGCEDELSFKLEPPTTGEVYYWSRSWPRKTKSFYYEYDAAYMKAGHAVLEEAREHYVNDEIPPRPEHFQWSIGPCQYCVAPWTKVLTAGLQWVPAYDLEVGQELVAFEDQTNGARTQHKTSVVKNIETIERPRVSVTTQFGPTTVSEEHLFLVARAAGRMWVQAKSLSVGDSIVAALGAPWKTEDTREAGYLSGLFDGEGTIARGHVSVAQAEGPVLDEIKRLLDDRGFTYSVDVVTSQSDRPCYRIRINGGMPEQIRLVGTMQPIRLVRKSKVIWEGTATWSKITTHAIVSDVKKQVDGPVLAIETSTGTLITDGLYSHNCNLKTFCRLDSGLAPRKRKPDEKLQRAKLTESHGVDQTRELRPHYDPQKIRDRVFQEWPDG